MELLTFVTTVYATARYGCGPGALAQIVCACRQLQEQVGRTLQVSELSEQLILEHLTYMRQHAMAAATINRRRGHFLGVWKLAYKRGENANNYWQADIPTLRPPSRRPVAWSIEHLGTMLRQAHSVRVTVHHPFGPACWRALIMLIYYTGLRISAVLQLRRQDLTGQMLLVPHQIQKDAEEMAFRLPMQLVLLLDALPRPNGLDEMLIPWPWRIDAGAKMFAKYILRPAGLPDDRRLKFHAIRRTVATIVASRKGKEAAREIMGHSCLKVTERYLADPSTVDPTLPANISPIDVLPELGSV